jgi:hypothetical protein
VLGIVLRNVAAVQGTGLLRILSRIGSCAPGSKKIQNFFKMENSAAKEPLLLPEDGKYAIGGH